MNLTILHKVKHNLSNPYLSQSMILIRDQRLDIIAKGIMQEILSTDFTQWHFTISALIQRLQISEGLFDKSWKQLKQFGYVEQKYIGNHKWSYNFYEIGDFRHLTGSVSEIEEPQENMKQKCERKRREADYFSKIKSRHLKADRSEKGGVEKKAVQRINKT